MTGALPYQHIKNLIQNNRIKNANLKNIQPSSLDLTISNRIFRLPFIFIPQPNETIEDLIQTSEAEEITFDYPLELNTPYLIKLKEELDLPSDIYAFSNPKSSSGRVDLRVSMLADKIARFDSVSEKNYKGALWAIVEPKSFRIKLQPGDTLLQLRFFYSDTRFNDSELQYFFEEWTPLFSDHSPIPFQDIKINDGDGGLIMTVDLRGELVGWRSEGSQKFLDFSKEKNHNPLDFFTPIYRNPKNILSVRKGDFYILYTRERLRVPPNFAAEIIPVDARSGEFRSHYAGFIDPGWGFRDKSLTQGQPIVLELRSFDNNLILRDNQPICKVIFEKLAETPDVLYGNGGSHYNNQNGPRLSKHFK